MNNKETVKKVVDAFLAADLETALSYMTEDVKMGWPGFFNLAPGKDAIREFFKSVPEMTSSGIEDIIEEGNKVAATGSVTSKEKDGSLKNSYFCDVYELENGKVREIKSYMVFEQPKEK
ncbi:ketosteroid isomerase-like protein [Anseongella ginsenosidimutans]|uniref:Ketosteroid isomerase-like protein n=1 Tax=Anseongella ginsenosidimutans TaxID=496056 RepID=A0A4R3KP01_9SPHI|nr:nuclear transport factor 2 family protein [Anseongella ginsenosidimutans]QEC53903.1 nuclear transport factor 2 family protein [Anseongella ginsenosidimutans]TCS86288.1 ketosteroid isomerase-like protein [Anseongella ginsenosidimutans]